MNVKKYIKEKRVFCGNDYLEVDCYPYTETQKKRGTKIKKSAQKQTNLNDKNSKRYFLQLFNSNFTNEDLHLTLTYNKKFLPKTVQDAEREVTNFLRRISYKRKNEQLPPLKYILVTEYILGDEEKRATRFHHHIIINRGLTRDTLENLWKRPKKKGQKQGESIGFINADRIQIEAGQNGGAAICTYLTKNTNRKKRWSTSQNLIKPFSKERKNVYSRRMLEKFSKQPPDPTFWEKKYKGYKLINDEKAFVMTFNDITGWHMYLKLCRKC